MATFVKEAVGQSNSPSTSTSATFSSAPIAGNFLVLALAMDKNMATPTVPTGWTALSNQVSTEGSLLFAWKESAGTETTVTVAHTTATAGGNMWVGEYAEAGSGAWTILGSAQNPITTAVSNSKATGTTAAISQAGTGIAVAMVDSWASVTTVDAWGNGYAVRYSATALGSTSRAAVYVATKDESAGTAASSSFNWTGTADQAGAAIAVFARASSQVTASRATTWATAARATSSRVASWAVANVSSAAVSAARATTWGALARVAGTRATSWAVNTTGVPGTLISRWIGAPTAGGFTVAVKLSAAATARLKVSTAASLTTSPVYSSSASPDAQGYAKLTITGLAANTQYYYGVEVDGVLNTTKQGKGRTLPTGQASYSFAFGSCSSSGSDASTMATIRAKAPAFLVHLGDMHYVNPNTTDPTLWRDAFDAVLAGVNYGTCLAEVPTVYTWSDHDFSGNGSYSGSTGKGAAGIAFRQVVPHLPVPGDGGVYQTWTAGRVRFIQTDLRHYKTIHTATDNSSKTMMGATQKQWFKDTIANSTEPVIVWANEVPWISTDVTGDDWGRYQTERNELVAHIATTGKRLYIISGDMHAVACDDGSGSPGGIPVAHGAPFRQAASSKGGPYQQGPLPASGTTTVQQYGWLDVTDVGASITLKFTGFDSSNNQLMTMTTVVPMLTEVTASRATTWAVGSTATTAPVSASRVAGWVVRARATGSRATSWNVAGRVTATRGTVWQTLSSGTPTTTPGMRVRVFAPNGADLGPLPAPQSVSVAYPLNDIGGLTMSYSAVAPRVDQLGQPCEIAVEISADNGISWFEPINSRFVYLSDGRDPLQPGEPYSVEAKSYVWRLTKARVLPNNLLNADGKRAFLSATPGTILKTLFNEAQARGAMTGITHSSFGTGTDSAGAAWAKTLTIYYEPGLDYYAVLQDLADQGFIDFRMQGRALSVFNADAAMAQDRTVGAGQVVFRAGRDLTEAPFRRTWEGLADYAYFAGADGAKYEYSNPQADKPWGRQETFISNGSITDAGTMAVLTQAELSLGEQVRTEYTRGLDFTRASSLPFAHYSVGDYVWSVVDGSVAPERLRLRQLTLTRDEKGVVGGNVVLNDRFLEADVRAQRRIQGITNGASSGNGGGGTTGPGDPNDKTAPAAPTGLAGTSSAYMGPGGFPQAQVSLSWEEPTTNVDGTPLEDFDHYELFQRPFGSTVGNDRQFHTTTDTTADISPYQTGSNWTFSVLAVDQSGNRSAKSTSTNVGMAVDATAPQAPSQPIVTEHLGTVVIYWDGNPSTGSWEPDFSHIEVHSSTVNNFTPTAATQSDTLYGEGRSIVTDGVYGTPIYAKLIAVDTSGLKSPASTQASAAPQRLVNTDLIDSIVDTRLLADDAVDSAAIQDLAVGTAHMKDLSVVTAKIGDLAVNSAKISSLDVGKLTAGTMAVDVLLGGRIMTASSGNRIEMSGTGIRMYRGSTLTGHWNPSNGQMRIYNDTDASHTSSGHGLQFGESNAQNLIIDDNEIMSRFNGTYSGLNLNREGGLVLIGGKKGGFASGDLVTPRSDNHLIQMRGAVQIFNSADGDYADEFAPLMIGDRFGVHLWMDANELGCASGDVAVGMRINPPYADGTHHTTATYVGSDAIAIRRIASTQGGIFCEDGGGAIQMFANEVLMRTHSLAGYVPVVSSGAITRSSRTTKEQISDFDPLPVLRGAKSQQWKYRDDARQDWHFGPMAEDLPPELQVTIREDDDKTVAGVDLGSLIGVLWESNRLLLDRIETLEKRGQPHGPTG